MNLDTWKLFFKRDEGQHPYERSVSTDVYEGFVQVFCVSSGTANSPHRSVCCISWRANVVQVSYACGKHWTLSDSCEVHIVFGRPLKVQCQFCDACRPQSCSAYSSSLQFLVMLTACACCVGRLSAVCEACAAFGELVIINDLMFVLLE